MAIGRAHGLRSLSTWLALAIGVVGCAYGFSAERTRSRLTRSARTVQLVRERSGRRVSLAKDVLCGGGPGEVVPPPRWVAS